MTYVMEAHSVICEVQTEYVIAAVVEVRTLKLDHCSQKDKRAEAGTLTQCPSRHRRAMGTVHTVFITKSCPSRM
jgi:hypothetical protein